MIFKKTLLGLFLAAGLIGGCNPQTIQSRPVSYISRFENNNNSLEDKVANEVAQSVELIETYANYRIEFEGQIIEDRVGQRGSGTVLAEIDGKYYVLTANHVVEMPQVVSSSTAFSRYDGQVKSMLDLDLPQSIRNVGTSSAAITILGTPELAVNGIAGGEIVCSNPLLDYALISVPSNGQLQPLIRNTQAAIGDSDILSPADYTYAIGYSLALGRFISMGNVSNNNLPLGTGGGVTIERTDGFTFTSPISPGNSGGPVFTIADHKMYLSGIAVAYFVNGQNLNIAIKINDILQDIASQKCLNLKLSQQSPTSYSNSKK